MVSLQATKLKAVVVSLKTHANVTSEGALLVVAGLLVEFVVLVRRIRSHATSLQQQQQQQQQQPVLATPTPKHESFTFHTHLQLL